MLLETVVITPNRLPATLESRSSGIARDQEMPKLQWMGIWSAKVVSSHIPPNMKIRARSNGGHSSSLIHNLHQ